MSNMLNLYSIVALSPYKETVTFTYRGPSEELTREILSANLWFVVLNIDEVNISKETKIKASEELSDSKKTWEDIDPKKRMKEMKKRDDLIDSWRVERNMNKSCLICWKDPSYWDILVVIRSKKKWWRKIRPVCFCSNCVDKIDDQDVITAAYIEWEWFLTVDQMII